MFWSVSKNNNVWLFRTKYGDSWATMTFPLGAQVKRAQEKIMLVGIKSGEVPDMLNTIVLSERKLTLLISDSYGQECLNVIYDLPCEAYNQLISYVNNLPQCDGNQLVIHQF